MSTTSSQHQPSSSASAPTPQPQPLRTPNILRLTPSSASGSGIRTVISLPTAATTTSTTNAPSNEPTSDDLLYDPIARPLVTANTPTTNPPQLTAPIGTGQPPRPPRASRQPILPPTATPPTTTMAGPTTRMTAAAAGVRFGSGAPLYRPVRGSSPVTGSGAPPGAPSGPRGPRGPIARGNVRPLRRGGPPQPPPY